MTHWLGELIERQQVLVILGSGGVGKTTLAAAIALQGALRGRRTLVLTIDPARRLAGALGLEELTVERQRVPLEGLVPGTAVKGELWALMLDAPRTFDALVARYASSDEAKERILHHRLYRHMVDALAGSHDLAALEKLHELLDEGGYDLVVLDTPPKEHAFDFLDAPSRLLALVSQARLGWLLRPMAGLGEPHRGGGLRMLPTRLILRTLSRFTGADVLRDLATLTLALLDLSAGFRDRVARVAGLLQSPDCSFLVATMPDPFTVSEAQGQRDKLLGSSLPFAGFLVNRCQRVPQHAPSADEDLEQLAEQLARQPEVAEIVPPSRLQPLLVRLGQGLSLLRELAEQERQAIARLRGQAEDESPLLAIPELDEEIHSVSQLLRFGTLLV